MTQRAWRVLVVDDNPINLEVAVQLLAKLGVQTDSANDGVQAVARALSSAYDLIVMDVQMPEMDGIEATRRIREALGPQPPIIALTANANADDRKACLAAGMDDYLSKPVMPLQLQSALQSWLPGWSAPAAPAPEPAQGPPAARVAAADGPFVNAPSRDADPSAARLAAIAGFDLAGSLRNLGGQMPRLERVLRRFVATYRAGEPALMQAAAQGDTAALWQVCHALRGACAVLCADALVQRIEALESTLEAALEVTPESTADGTRTRAARLAQVRLLQTEVVTLARQLQAALAVD